MLDRVRLTSLAVALVLVAWLAAAASARAQTQLTPSPQGAPALTPGGALPDAARVPATVALTSGWSFRTDAGDHGLAARWGTATPSSGWSAITLPHLFDRRPVESEFKGTVGWYRLRFRAPAAAPGFSWGVRFEQVRRTATVWLNGRRLGSHADPYVPFALPAAGLRAGQVNELVVRVDNRKAAEPREGWWNWGGIPRAVSLVPRGALRLRTPGLMSSVDCSAKPCRATLRFDGTLENRGTTPIATPSVALRLTPPGGGEPLTVTRTARALMPGEETRLRFAVPVPDAKLWSPERPDRYAATLVTTADGAATQVDRRAIGLRGVEVRNGVLELNGRQLDLRGASIQEDAAGVGPALSDADVARIVSDLKAVHANVTRAHYLLNPKLLDALDAAGIMVWSQAPVYHRDVALETAAGREEALQTLRGTVLAARSHPSVITHSVANELSATPDTLPGTRQYLVDARREVEDLDPTIPASIDLLSYPGYPAARAFRQYELLGINSYFGWYPGKADHPTGNLQDLGPYLDRMRTMYPTSAMVLTEFGAESTEAGPAATKETYAFQADYVRDVLAIVGRRPYMSGAIYWTLREFAVKPNWDGGAGRKGIPRDGIHHKGLLTYAGVRKPAWDVAARAFAATPLYRSVTAADGLGMPDGDGGGGSRLLPAALVSLVLAFLAFDLWLVAGIARRRREREAMADALARWEDGDPVELPARRPRAVA